MIDDVRAAQDLLPALVPLAEVETFPAQSRMIDRAGRASGRRSNGLAHGPALAP
jgi:hypothetical protein